MKAKLVELVKFESFQPAVIGIFTNPFYFLRRSLCKGISKHKKQLGGIMLDFGCGRKPYKNLFNVVEYVGVDIEVSGHSHVNSEVDVFYDGRRIPFKDNHFDSLLCSEVFEHLFNIDEILSELNRVLKPNAKGLITVPFCWPEHEQPYDFARYTSFGMKKLLGDHGFKIVSMDKSGHFFESIWQLVTLYFYSLFKTKRRILNVLLTILIISPFNLIGILLTSIVPKQHDYYHNLVILVQKSDSGENTSGT